MKEGAMTWDRWPPIRRPRKRRAIRVTGEMRRPPQDAKLSKHRCPECLGQPKLRELPGESPWVACRSCNKVYMPPKAEEVR